MKEVRYPNLSSFSSLSVRNQQDEDDGRESLNEKVLLCSPRSYVMYSILTKPLCFPCSQVKFLAILKEGKIL